MNFIRIQITSRSHGLAIVKESENVSGQKSEEGSEMKVKGEYMGKKDEMILEVVQKEQNKYLLHVKLKVHFKLGKAFKSFKAMEIILQKSTIV